MRYVICLLLALTMFGCGQSITTPNRVTDQLPTYTIAVDNVQYVVDMDRLMDGRSVQAVTPGTNMTADQLRQYFAVNIVNDPSFGWPLWAKCPVYRMILNTFKAQPDATVLSWVVTMESNGYDVPNGPPPRAIC